MPDNLEKDTTASQQVELAIGRLHSLSTLACIAVQFLPKLLQSQFHPSALIDIIESDPVLTSRILSLIGGCGVSLPDGRFSISKALDKIPAHEIRDALLTINVSKVSEQGDSTDAERISHHHHPVARLYLVRIGRFHRIDRPLELGYVDLQQSDIT